MEIKCGNYEVKFEQGGVFVYKGDKLLYFNKRPIYFSIKDIGAISVALKFAEMG